MNILGTILKKYNWPTRSTSVDSSIQDIEQKIGFTLPLDYKTLLSNYLGFETSIGEEYLKLWDADNIVSLNEGYEILGNLPMTLGIGDNGAGEFIALEKLETGNFRVVLTPYIDLNKECYVEIGDSFSDFLLRTDNGEKWFK